MERSMRLRGPDGTDEPVLVLHTMRCGARQELIHFREEGHDVERVTEMMVLRRRQLW